MLLTKEVLMCLLQPQFEVQFSSECYYCVLKEYWYHQSLAHYPLL